MTGDEARVAITQKFLADWAIAHPTIEVFVEGDKEPDLNTQTDPFIMFKVCLPRVYQADLAITPIKRYDGIVEIGLFIPQGGGTKDFFLMMTTIENSLAVQTISGIRMYSADPIERQPAIGWQAREVLVNYSFDSIN